MGVVDCGCGQFWVWLVGVEKFWVWWVGQLWACLMGVANYGCGQMWACAMGVANYGCGQIWACLMGGVNFVGVSIEGMSGHLGCVWWAW